MLLQLQRRPQQRGGDGREARRAGGLVGCTLHLSDRVSRSGRSGRQQEGGRRRHIMRAYMCVRSAAGRREEESHHPCVHTCQVGGREWDSEDANHMY